MRSETYSSDISTWRPSAYSPQLRDSETRPRVQSRSTVRLAAQSAQGRTTLRPADHQTKDKANGLELSSAEVVEIMWLATTSLPQFKAFRTLPVGEAYAVAAAGVMQFRNVGRADRVLRLMGCGPTSLLSSSFRWPTALMPRDLEVTTQDCSVLQCPC